MPVGVVHRLEAVEVDHHQGVAFAAGVERPVEGATVRQTGERIGLGLDVQAIAVAQALEDGTRLGGDQLHHLGGRVVEVRPGPRPGDDDRPEAGGAVEEGDVGDRGGSAGGQVGRHPGDGVGEGDGHGLALAEGSPQPLVASELDPHGHELGRLAGEVAPDEVAGLVGGGDEDDDAMAARQPHDELLEDQGGLVRRGGGHQLLGGVEHPREVGRLAHPGAAAAG